MLIAFYILAVLAVLGGLALLLVRNPVYCALALVGTLFCVAGIFVLLNHEFVAAIQLLIYAGAIMVLFLFVIMLLNLRTSEPFAVRFNVHKIIGVALAAGILAQVTGVIYSPDAVVTATGTYPVERLAEEGVVHVIGELLVTEYVLPLEVISVLLMVAIMGAVLLAKRRPVEPPEGEGE